MKERCKVLVNWICSALSVTEEKGRIQFSYLWQVSDTEKPTKLYPGLLSFSGRNVAWMLNCGDMYSILINMASYHVERKQKPPEAKVSYQFSEEKI